MSPFNVTEFHERVYRKPPRIHPVKIGIAVVAVLAVLSYLALFKSVPFTSPGYELKAVFESAGTLVTGSPVRIAGVNVGEVTAVEGSGEIAEVSFTIDEEGRPVRADAYATIRPRLFLEGNLFIDLRPGSPGEQELDSGGTIPVTRTAIAVQFDEVLGTLTAPVREDLRLLLDGFGSALNDQPTAAQDQGQDPAVRGESAARALSDSLADGGEAGRTSAILARAMRGVREGDLERFISDQSHVFAVLAMRDEELSELITNLSITAGALAAESRSLGEAVAELDPTLGVAEPAFASTQQTLPELRRLARELTPAMPSLAQAIEAGGPWLGQALPLLGRPELGGIARMLRRATPDLASATFSLGGSLSEIEALSRCATDVLVPVGDTPITDEFGSGSPAYRDLFYGAVFQSGEGASFDGNGPYLRVQPGGGPVRVTAPNPNGGLRNDVLYGNTISAPLGTRPTMAASRPPINYGRPCHENAVPDLNGAAAIPGPASPVVQP